MTLLSKVICLNPLATLCDIAVDAPDDDPSIDVLRIAFSNGRTYRFALRGAPVMNRQVSQSLIGVYAFELQMKRNGSKPVDRVTVRKPLDRTAI